MNLSCSDHWTLCMMNMGSFIIYWLDSLGTKCKNRL